MNVPFLSFEPQHAPLRDAMTAAFSRVYDSYWYVLGDEVKQFEQEYAAFNQVAHTVGVANGLDALVLALRVLGVGPGDEVIVPSNTYIATWLAVTQVGATPVPVEPDPATSNLDPALIAAALTPRTRAIMPVHLYGHPADLPALSAIADRHGLQLYEDAAQAHAAAIDGKPVGAWGLAGSFSFYPTKNMTSGEGGMITTASPELARAARVLRNQGMERRYENEVIGFNTRMTDIHAAIGRVQLRKLAGWTAKRQANAAFLTENLNGVVCPPTAPGAVHVFHQYTIRVVGHDRDAFALELTRRGIGNGVYYPTPIHRLPSFRLDVDLPQTERVAREVLSLPIYPSLTQNELDSIVEAVNAVANAGS